MWMWNLITRRDVFVAKVEKFKPGMRRILGDTWVYWYNKDRGGWVQDKLCNFEPPREH